MHSKQIAIKGKELRDKLSYMKECEVNGRGWSGGGPGEGVYGYYSIDPVNEDNATYAIETHSLEQGKFIAHAFNNFNALADAYLELSDQVKEWRSKVETVPGYSMFHKSNKDLCLKEACDLLEAMLPDCNMLNYSSNLQKMIQRHVKGGKIEGDLFNTSPFFAEVLNDDLADGS